MNRDEFFQQAMLRLADTMLMRADKVPKPEELAKKAREYAQALHDEMLAGLTALDIFEMTDRAVPPEDAYDNGAPPEPRSGVPTLFPGGRVEAPSAPSCPECRAKMKRRNGRNGPFWGCTEYPRCRSTLNLE